MIRGTTSMLAVVATATCAWTSAAAAQQATHTADRDARVRAFLDRSRWTWRDMNVPAVDGQRLYDLVLQHRFTRALEVGTSTGHSAIWIAWALSKTGGRLTTIEIDERRHRQALANFREAGVADVIDARLADAHELVPRLDGPFDFVFQDADKDWYTRYFEDIYPKLTPGGCYVAHNVSGRGSRDARTFLAAVDAKADMATEIVGGRGSGGMSVSCRTTPR